jgi:tetratricopeptide (TPR) repeat protein
MRLTPLVASVAVLSSVAVLAQTPAAEDLVKQGRALVSQGKHDEAITLYRQALKLAPQSFDTRLAMGIVLDLQGQYAEARTHLSEAIRRATVGAPRNQAMTAMAISLAFESRTDEALKYLEPVYKQQLADQDLAGAAATTNAVGRLYLETGDPQRPASGTSSAFNTHGRFRGYRNRSASCGNCAGCMRPRASPPAKDAQTKRENSWRRSNT